MKNDKLEFISDQIRQGILSEFTKPSQPSSIKNSFGTSANKTVFLTE